MNALGKPYRKKNPIQKILEKSKIQSEIAAYVKKPLARKRIFVQTPFSHFTLELREKKSRRKTPRFSLHFRFVVTTITTPI